MPNIVLGDNGTEILDTITDESGIVDLTSATSITVNFSRSNGTSFSKSMSIVNALEGTCRAVLTSEDISYVGTYTYRVTVEFTGGKVFTGTKHKLVVEAK